MIEQEQNDSRLLIAEALGACADGLNACVDRIEELERRVARLEAESRASKVASPKAKPIRPKFAGYPRRGPNGGRYTEPTITP
jgi:hypothetical protein